MRSSTRNFSGKTILTRNNTVRDPPRLDDNTPNAINNFK